MSLVAYVAEDGLEVIIGGEALVLRRSYVQGNARARKQEWVGLGSRAQVGYRDLWGITFKM